MGVESVGAPRSAPGSRATDVVLPNLGVGTSTGAGAGAGFASSSFSDSESDDDDDVISGLAEALGAGAEAVFLARGRLYWGLGARASGGV